MAISNISVSFSLATPVVISGTSPPERQTDATDTTQKVKASK